MAKILSPLISVGSGSVAGLTFTRTREHQVVIRQRTVPVNPNTQFQQQIRAAFALAVSLWEDIVQADRDAWQAYAETLTWTTKLGNSYTPLGRQVFIQVLSLGKYLVALGIKEDFTRTTPGQEPLALPSPIVESDIPTQIGIGFSLKETNPFEHKVFFAHVIGPSISQGTNFYKGPYDSSKTAVESTPPGASDATDFLGLVDGARYPWRSRCFNMDEVNQGMRLGTVQHGIATASEVIV